MQTQVETLTADRRVILDAVAGERRRIERNLHDGVQARLVALGIDLGLAEAMLPERADEAKALVAAARDKAARVDRRAAGHRPRAPSVDPRGPRPRRRALGGGRGVADPDPPALRARHPTAARRRGGGVLHRERGREQRAEARGARSATVDVTGGDRTMQIVVHDDGLGGADTADGTGLAGIDARVRGLGGSMRLASPAGGPTVVAVELPYVDDEGRVLR